MTIASKVALFAALSAFILSPAVAAPEVILLGSAHDLHLREQSHYSLPDLRHEIEALHPDAVCGEITPEAYGTVMEGNFPIEAAYIAEIAPELHVKFVPADWRVAYEWQKRAWHLVPKELKDRAEEIDKAQGEGVMNFKGASLFDYIDGPEFLALSDRKFHEINGEDTPADIAAGAWHERNRKIVENCLAGTKEAKRVVIMIGSNHLAQLRRELTTQGVPFQLAPRLFTPSGLGSVPQSVVARWRRNFAGVKAIADGTMPASSNDRAMAKSVSRNFKEREALIEVYAK